MAPEMSDRTFNEQSFKLYKAISLYALGLVLWEVLRRCQTTPEGWYISLSKVDENYASFRMINP